jgi:hypothetical protein
MTALEYRENMAQLRRQAAASGVFHAFWDVINKELSRLGEEPLTQGPAYHVFDIAIASALAVNSAQRLAIENPE